MVLHPLPRRHLPVDIWIVSEDGPGEWRVADGANDAVFGPFPDQAAATRAALAGVRPSRAWEIHVLDCQGFATGTLDGSGWRPASRTLVRHRIGVEGHAE